MANEYGDYQTSMSLANRVTSMLSEGGTASYTHMVEPTFGDGNFIVSSINNIASLSSASGFELQRSHYDVALKKVSEFSNVTLDLRCGDIFSGKIGELLRHNETNLVVGNLPWVTVSQLSAFESKNIPKKANIKGLRGFDALTGKSNFDISEYISLLFLHELAQLDKPSTLAVLVKNIVAQNLLRYLPSSNLNPSSFDIFEFDAKKEFGVSADAGLMVIKFDGRHSERVFKGIANVHDLNNPTVIKSKFGWTKSKFVSNVGDYAELDRFDNVSDWDWRSGIKHDAGKVMELIRDGTKWLNGLNEEVSLEDNFIYPLVKSSDVRKQDIHTSFRKYVLVPQNRMGQDTSFIADSAPLTWEYLQNHAEVFSNRKSSIYKNKNQFAIFGIGEYSFKPFKVAISGMYKVPKFSILPACDGKPVMGDDTVYFVGFDEMKDAVIFASVLNSTTAQRLLESLVFISSKRPYTKDILKRIDVIAILEGMSLDDINETAYQPVMRKDVNQFISKYSRVDRLF